MELIVLTVFLGLIALFGSRLAGLLRTHNRPFSALAIEEIGTVAAPGFWAGLICLIIYFSIYLNIENHDHQLVFISIIEHRLDIYNNNYWGSYISTILSYFLFLSIVLLLTTRVTDRASEVLGRDVVPTLIKPLFDRIKTIRKKLGQGQVLLLVLANVTFLGAQGGSLQGLALAQIDLGVRGVAEIEQMEREIAALVVAKEVIEDLSLPDDPTSSYNKALLDPTLFQTLRAITKDEAALKQRLNLDTTTITEPLDRLNRRARDWSIEARNAQRSSVERREFRLANAGAQHHHQRSPLPPELSDFTPDDLRAAKDGARASLDRTMGEAPARSQPLEQQLKLTAIELLAGVLVDAENIAPLKALTEKIPILKPVMDTAAGITSGMAIEALKPRFFGPQSATVTLDQAASEDRIAKLTQHLREKTANLASSIAANEPASDLRENLVRLRSDLWHQERDRQAFLDVRSVQDLTLAQVRLEAAFSRHLDRSLLDFGIAGPERRPQVSGLTFPRTSGLEAEERFRKALKAASQGEQLFRLQGFSGRDLAYAEQLTVRQIIAQSVSDARRSSSLVQYETAQALLKIAEDAEARPWSADLDLLLQISRPLWRPLGDLGRLLSLFTLRSEWNADAARQAFEFLKYSDPFVAKANALDPYRGTRPVRPPVGRK